MRWAEFALLAILNSSLHTSLVVVTSMMNSRITSHLAAGPSRLPEQPIPSTSSSASLSCPLHRQQLSHSQIGSVHRIRRDQRAQRLYAKRRDPIISPYIQTGEHPEDVIDMFGYLMRNRVIFIGSRINDEVATRIVASLLAMEAMDETADIKLYINSPGGQSYSVIALLDTIEAIKPDVTTIAMGLCASTATVLLAAGTKGKRFAMPSARIMMHQPAGGAMGSADEVNIQASELNRTMKVIHRFYQRYTGLELERIEEETDRDNFMSPKQAQELGIIDGIILSSDMSAPAATAVAA